MYLIACSGHDGISWSTTGIQLDGARRGSVVWKMGCDVADEDPVVSIVVYCQWPITKLRPVRPFSHIITVYKVYVPDILYTQDL